MNTKGKSAIVSRHPANEIKQLALESVEKKKEWFVTIDQNDYMKMPILNSGDGLKSLTNVFVRRAIILLNKEVTGQANRFLVRVYSSHCSAIGHLHKCRPTQSSF